MDIGLRHMLPVRLCIGFVTVFLGTDVELFLY